MTTSIVSQLYTSRKVMLQLLSKRGYDISEYEHINFNETRSLYNNKQLDMLLENKKTGRKVYIKYHLQTKLRPTYVYDYCEDLYNLEEILESADDIIIITKDKINDTLTKLMETLYIKESIFCTIFTLKDLQFNILDHDLVPPHRILSNEEIEPLQKKFNITELSQFPEISRFDPVAKAIGLRPNNICEIIRPSKTAITTKYYRLCY